jgi:hypothetical protein
MPLNTARVDGRARAARSIVGAFALAIALAGCAGMSGRSSGPAAEDTPYVGVFTGDYVDGRPLYRFPPIYVVGSRGSIGDL